MHPNPCEYADIVTSTTHKTLRGPRAGLILAKEKYGAAIDKTVFPGMQGGPLVHVVAAKAVCFLEAMQPAFVEYQKQVVANAQALAQSLMDAGFRVVSGGTDTHLMLVDVFSKGVRGKEAEEALDRARITVNKNAIPFDVNPPLNPSGIRLGSPAVTTRGFREAEMREVGTLIAEVLQTHCGRRCHRGRPPESRSADGPLPVIRLEAGKNAGVMALAHRHRCAAHPRFRHRHVHPKPGSRAGRHRYEQPLHFGEPPRRCAHAGRLAREFPRLGVCQRTIAILWTTSLFPASCIASRRTWFTSRSTACRFL